MPFFQKEEEAMTAASERMGKCSDFNQEAIDYQRKLHERKYDTDGWIAPKDTVCGDI